MSKSKPGQSLLRGAREALDYARGRGGTWKGDPDACTSGKRLLSGGYGRYENWGLRAAVSHTGNSAPPELTLDLGDGVTMSWSISSPVRS